MPTGRLGAVDLSANTNTQVYVVPDGKIASLNVNICNRSGNPATVRLAVSQTTSPSGAEWIEYDTVLPAKTPLERTGLVLAAGQRVIAFSNIAAVSVQAFGFEESA